MQLGYTRSGLTRKIFLPFLYATRETAAEEPFQEPTGAVALVYS